MLEFAVAMNLWGGSIEVFVFSSVVESFTQSSQICCADRNRLAPNAVFLEFAIAVFFNSFLRTLRLHFANLSEAGEMSLGWRGFGVMESWSLLQDWKNSDSV